MNRTFHSLIHWIDSITQLIYPRLCPACGKAVITNENFLCLECEWNLPLTPYFLHLDNPVSRVFEGRIPLEIGTSFLQFQGGGMAQKLLHRLKYKGETQIGAQLGYRMGLELRHIPLPDALIPMPLHPTKKKKRGFNQSSCIARGMAQALDIPVREDLVRRIKANPSQTRLNRLERWNNVEGIFELTELSEPIQYIWLIDDTLTTGSTLEACARPLIGKGIKIGVITLAYAR